MPAFDPIATQTMRTADHPEPSFVHRAGIDVATGKLSARPKQAQHPDPHLGTFKLHPPKEVMGHKVADKRRPSITCRNDHPERMNF